MEGTENRTAMETAKEIETIEKQVKEVSMQFGLLVGEFTAIMDNRLFGMGQSEKGKLESEPVPDNKLDRIIGNLRDINKKLQIFMNADLKRLDEELEKL